MNERGTGKLLQRAVYLDRCRRRLKEQCLSASERRQRLASIQDPFLRRAEQVEIDRLDDLNRRSIGPFNRTIDRHNARAEELGLRSCKI